MNLHSPSPGCLYFQAPRRLRPPSAILNSLQTRSPTTRPFSTRKTLHHRPQHASSPLAPPIRTFLPSLSSSTSVSRRYASASTSAATTPRKPKRAPPPPSKHSIANTRSAISLRLNPPETAYPPPLNVASRKPGQGWASYLYNSGKTYVSFYKSGIRHVTANWRHAKEVRHKLQKSARRDGSVSDSKRKEEGKGALVLPCVSRGDWQLFRRSSRDVRRLVPFGALVILLGEWLPLVALWVTPLVPGPCRIPAQVRREAEKLEKRRRERKMRIENAEWSEKNALPAPRTVSIDDGDALSEIMNLNKPQLLKISSQLDAHSRLWDILYINPPMALLMWSVRRQLEYITMDDLLIKRDGGVAGLNEEEVRIAAGERGYDTLGKSGLELRKTLHAWVEGAGG